VPEPKEIAVAILNYNGKKWLEKFLLGVVKNSERGDVVIIDNGSTDDSLEYLQSYFPDLQTIVLDKNYGFTGGYNRGLSELKHEYFVLLNSDIEVTPNWLDAPLDLLKNDQSIAACQPKIKAYNKRTHFEHAGAAGGMMDKLGYPFCRGRIFMKAQEDVGQFEDEHEIFWATGACFFIRAKLYHQFHGLQEEFSAHMDEIDLCWRLKSAGHKIFYTPHSTVFHVGGGTLSTSNPRKTFLNFRNGLALIYINLPRKKLIPILLFRLILDGIAALEFALVGHFKDAWAVFKAHMSFYAQFNTWRKARTFAKHTWVRDAHKDTYNKSIVWQYFIKKNRTFKELD